MEIRSSKDNKGAQEDGGGLTNRLLASRTVVISGQVDSELAQKVMQQLVLLDHDDPKARITILVNSPGGEVFSGFAIYDTMRFVSAPIVTVVTGLAASMGSIIALAPDKGRRYSLPNAKFLIHQPLMTGYQGRATDLEIQATEILRDRERIIEIYAQNTGKKPAEIAVDIERDKWLTAEQALDYGLIEHIITKRDELGD
ncbi:MAG TPA: ATP-dependent Clp protease proteolytic subunit [bacterium]|nr:ATP-dependent Clp protease proteolytic subunit [bacterium]